MTIGQRGHREVAHPPRPHGAARAARPAHGTPPWLGASGDATCPPASPHPSTPPTRRTTSCSSRSLAGRRPARAARARHGGHARRVLPRLCASWQPTCAPISRAVALGARARRAGATSASSPEQAARAAWVALVAPAAPLLAAAGWRPAARWRGRHVARARARRASAASGLRTDAVEPARSRRAVPQAERPRRRAARKRGLATPGVMAAGGVDASDTSADEIRRSSDDVAGGRSRAVPMAPSRRRRPRLYASSSKASSAPSRPNGTPRTKSAADAAAEACDGRSRPADDGSLLAPTGVGRGTAARRTALAADATPPSGARRWQPPSGAAEQALWLTRSRRRRWPTRAGGPDAAARSRQARPRDDEVSDRPRRRGS